MIIIDYLIHFWR